MNSSRVYLDYNSTSPLSDSVMQFLRKGDFSFSNASSIHASGQRSLKMVNETKKILKKSLFPETNHRLVFNSGVTESFATAVNSLKKGDAFFCFSWDHPCIQEQIEPLHKKGVECYVLPVLADGSFDMEECSNFISSSRAQRKLLNYTFVHNETGVIWPISLALELKKRTGVLVHVDCAQYLGRLELDEHWDTGCDYYSFSGHKFGAMKGVGFSFIKEEFPYEPLLRGGAQQEDMRSGTLNHLGIYSLKLAFLDLVKIDHKKIRDLKESLIIKLNQNSSGRFSLVLDAEKMNTNTIFCYLEDIDSQLLFTKLSIEGFDVGLGSACSSGLVKENTTLKALGLGHKSQQVLRLSIGWDSLQVSDQKWDQLLLIIQDICDK